MSSFDFSTQPKTLTVFFLTMINIIAVISLRNLSLGAEYGMALIFFYGLAALLFFIPIVLVTAELSRVWPHTGGAYIWIKEAFGMEWGTVAVAMQWLYNLVWYPTIFSFLAGVLAYLFNPSLVNNKGYMISTVLILFWSAVGLSTLGLRVSRWVAVAGATVGTLLPLLVIISLAFFYLFKSSPLFSWHHFFPHAMHLQNLAFFTNILFALMGIEMSAVHASDVKNPSRDYPRALYYSAAIILISLVGGSLSIALVVPADQLNLISGTMDAFTVFLKVYHLEYLIWGIAGLIILGSFSGISLWIAGPARALWVASLDYSFPKWVTRLNAREIPIGILFIQGLIVTVLALLFLIFPNINTAYWILSNLTAQLALIYYFIFFLAAIRLRYQHPERTKGRLISLRNARINGLAGLGALVCFLVILFGFLPPQNMGIIHIMRYESILIIGSLSVCLLPIFFRHYRNK